MKKRLLAALLILATVILSLASCAYLPFVSGQGDYLTRGELWNMINGTLLGDTTVIGGDTNNIYIEGDTDLDDAAASRALLSAVSVYASFKSISSGQLVESTGAGSGVIYKMNKETGDAYIITNYHVVHNARTGGTRANEVYLFLYGQEGLSKYAIPATYVGGCMQADIAVLKVTGSRILAESLAVEATLADSDGARVLDTAIAVGNPEGRGISATLGHVSVDNEDIELTLDGVNKVKIRVMRIDTAVNEGNSGGGLFNSRGELIGIVNAKPSDTSIEGIGYAIPSNLVSAVADNIIHYCADTSKTSAYRCLLGVTVKISEQYLELDTESGALLRREKIVVDAISAGGTVDGVLAVGDELISVTVDGVEYEITRLHSIGDAMLRARVGDLVAFKIIRGGVETTVTLFMPESALQEYK